MSTAEGDGDIDISLVIDPIGAESGKVYSEGYVGTGDYWLGEGVRPFRGSTELRAALIEQATAVIDMALEYLQSQKGDR